MSTDNPNAYGHFNWLKLIDRREPKISERKLRAKYTGTRKGFKRMMKARGQAEGENK